MMDKIASPGELWKAQGTYSSMTLYLIIEYIGWDDINSHRYKAYNITCGITTEVYFNEHNIDVWEKLA